LARTARFPRTNGRRDATWRRRYRLLAGDHPPPLLPGAAGPMEPQGADRGGGGSALASQRGAALARGTVVGSYAPGARAAPGRDRGVLASGHPLAGLAPGDPGPSDAAGGPRTDRVRGVPPGPGGRPLAGPGPRVEP